MVSYWVKISKEKKRTVVILRVKKSFVSKKSLRKRFIKKNRIHSFFNTAYSILSFNI